MHEKKAENGDKLKTEKNFVLKILMGVEILFLQKLEQVLMP